MLNIFSYKKILDLDKIKIFFHYFLVNFGFPYPKKKKHHGLFLV